MGRGKLPLYGTSSTTGALIGPANSSGQAMFGRLSPLRTVSLQVEVSLPDSHVISPSSPSSRLLKISWCLPPPRFLILIRSFGSIGLRLIFHSQGAV